MPKKLRETGQGLTHHCFTKCHGRKSLLHGETGRKFFLESVQMCKEKYDFELIAADIISDHIHLVIKTIPGKETISFLMQYIKSRTAEKYNRATGRTGPFWNERFSSTIIEKSVNPEQYMKLLLWFISINTGRVTGSDLC